jgi:iron complex outermembrane receptor protein
MKKLLTGASMVALATALAAPAFAEAEADATAAVTEIIVTGTRTVGVKAEDSAAPVQVVGAAALTRTGSTDLASSLVTSVPSLNINNTGGDLAALSIEAALRGLSPNDTLVLVNGKRRHVTSNLAVLGGSAYSGSATTDLSFIPVGAIDHVEVLTDGAAAQYGTDAIAGVVNIILKKNADGGFISGTGGQNYGGDGKTGAWSLNKGFSLGDKGYVNVTLEQRYGEETLVGIGDRRFQNPDGSINPAGSAFTSGNAANNLVNKNVVNAKNYPHENGVVGAPQYNIYNGFFNAAYAVTDGIELYSFGSYGDRHSSHFENYRVPSLIQGTTSTGVHYYPLPNGFDPSEADHETDYSITGGVRGTVATWAYDLAVTYGADENQIFVKNTANAELFPILAAQSPTPIVPQRLFYDGAFKGTQSVVTVDFDKGFDVGLASPLNIAFGAESRRETYAISAGEPSSYFGSGAQSFDGYTPFDAGEHSRTNYGFYIDGAADVIAGWHVDLAARYEHYSDFGETTVGKLTSRYDFNPMFAIRGTVSTGFRAPTLAEEFYSGTNVSPGSASLTLPADSASAAVAGFQPLRPEKSTNYSVGFVTHPMDRLQITLDAYYIKVKDRILTTSTVFGTVGSDITSPGVLAAIANKLGAPIANATSLSYTGISVFTNAADTETKGVELTGTYASDFGDLGHVDWTVGFNYNENTFTRVAPLPTQVTATANAAQAAAAAANGQAPGALILSATAKSSLETSTPKEKAILQANWTLDKWSVNLRSSIYGKTSEQILLFANGNLFTQEIPVTAIFDLNVAYQLFDGLKVEVGANNLLDKIPPKAPNIGGRPADNGRVFGVPYGFSPYGTGGGYYYGRVTYSF